MKSSARLYKDSKTRSLSASSAVQYIEYKELSYQRLKQLLVLSARDRVAAGKSTDFTNMNTDTRTSTLLCCSFITSMHAFISPSFWNQRSTRRLSQTLQSLVNKVFFCLRDCNFQLAGVCLRPEGLQTMCLQEVCETQRSYHCHSRISFN